MLNYTKVLMFEKHDCIFDIGANAGQFTKEAIKVAPLVWAFEPHPQYIKILKKISNFVRLKSFFKKNIIIQPVGLSDHEGEATLFHHEVLSGSHSIIPGKIEEDDQVGKRISNHQTKILIKLKKLDQYLHQKSTFIKIDVEGAESKVLKGGLNYLKQYKPDLFVEVRGNPKGVCGETIREVYEMLTPLGYNMYMEQVLGLNLEPVKIEWQAKPSFEYRPHFLHGDAFFTTKSISLNLTK